VRKVRTALQLSGQGPDGLDGLDMSRYMQTTAETGVDSVVRLEALYDVVSVVNHHGKDATGGHYTAHCRHCVDGQWYAFNDDRVRAIATSEVWLPEDVYIICLLRASGARSAKLRSLKCRD